MPMLAFYEPSAGIIGWRKNEKTARFFSQWESEYQLQVEQNGSDGAWDQRSMRAALWNTDVSLAPLGTDWQLYSFESGICMNRVKLVHGRDRSAEFLIKNSHKITGPRMYIKSIEIIHLNNIKIFSYLIFLLKIIYFLLKRFLRLFLHYLYIYKLPENKRKM
jgi:hypothetical protein